MGQLKFNCSFKKEEIIFVTDTVPYYEDFNEIKKKIWSMLTNAVKDRGSPF